MIVDSLKNIEVYKHFSPDIFAGLKFIYNAKPDLELGIYQINKRVKAFVTEYQTVACFERGYEVYKYAIDIQYSRLETLKELNGHQSIKWM